MDISLNENTEKELLSVVTVFLNQLDDTLVTNEVTLNSNLGRDLHIDSLGKVELLSQIESHFGLYFPETLLMEAQTVKDILIAIQHIEKNTKNTITSASDHPLEHSKFNPETCKTLVEVLLQRGKKEPTRPYLYLQNEQGKEELIRYGDLLKFANKVAIGLQKNGLEHGNTVAIMLPTGRDFFFAFFGIMLAGGIPVPIYPPFSKDRIEEYITREAGILGNAEISIMITFPEAKQVCTILKQMISSLHLVTTVPKLLATKGSLKRAYITEQDPAFIQYTSGSTNVPKGVLLSHYNIIENVKAIGKGINFGPNDVGVSWLPLYHDMGLIGSCLTCFYHGFPIVVLSPLAFLARPERWLWAIHNHKGTLTAAPNFAYELCNRRIEPESIEGLDLSSLRMMFNGAEAVRPSTLKTFIEKFGPYGFTPDKMRPVYGLAESCVGLLIPRERPEPLIDTIKKQPFEDEFLAIKANKNDKNTLQFVCCGEPLPGHFVKIVSDSGLTLGERNIGHLYFKGPSAMQGYYRNIPATKAIQHDDWWDSGDYAYIADGEVYITGRSKDMIIIAGKNYYPEEVEDIVSNIKDIRKGCIVAFGINDENLATEQLVVVAESRTTDKQKILELTNEIQNKIYLGIGITPYKVLITPPKTVPKTSSGKLQRSKLKQMYLNNKIGSNKLPASLQITKLAAKTTGTALLNIFKKLGCVIYSLYVWALYFIGVTIGAIVLLFTPLKLGNLIGKWIAKSVLMLSGMFINVKNHERLKESQSTIYVANHASYIDAVVMFAILPSTIQFVGKKEITHWPILGYFFKRYGHHGVDRKNIQQGIKDVENIKSSLKKGHSIMMFPEGTFRYSSGIKPFKLGAFKLAVETKTSITPIAICGTRMILRAHSWLFHPGKISVWVGEPISPENEEWEAVTQLKNKVRDKISEKTGEPIIDH